MRIGLKLPGVGAGWPVWVGLLCLLVPGLAGAQAHGQGRAHQDQQPGYLGVSLLDLDADAVARLHLKDTHGAMIVTIDRDAPAASAGLRARDVIVEVSGQRIDNVDALRRKLKETSAGSTITLRISREGVEQAVTVQLGDQAAIAARAWEQHFSAPGLGADGGDAAAPAAADTSFVAPRGHGAGSSFLGRFSLNTSYTGAEVDPLSTQLADYFGVHDGAGLLVRSVNENSPASAAGLKAGDVILRVNDRLVVSREDWTKQLHANRGRSVQLSVMRNRREQTMAMMAGGGKKR
jgi:serine protease Do